MKQFLAIIAFISATFCLHAQTGPWSGKIDINGTSLRLVFNISDQECTIDSPDQGATGIKAKMSYTPEGKIFIEIPSIGASYEGIYMVNLIAGEFIQGRYRFPLTLKPGALKLNRPQTPVGPFSYTTEEVSFSNGDAVLKGTLTRPSNCSRNTPVVLLVTGSGLQNRDEEIFEHKPFAVIADALANAGIASLRYDDRGFGESTGDLINLTISDLKDDALAGINLLRKEFSKVGVLGHSEGGSIAFMLASEKKVDFVISLAGAVIPMGQILLQQNRHIFTMNGFTEKDVDVYCDALSDAFNAIIEGKTPANINHTTLPTAMKQNFIAALQQLNTPYMKSSLSLDVISMLPELTCPVIAFNGSLDSQVDCKANLGALENGIKSGLVKTVEVNNANHLFQHCKTGELSEYKEIEETISPDVLTQIIAWIKDNTLRPATDSD